MSRRTVARDLSLLHPLTVLLFAGRSIVISQRDEEGTNISVDGKDQLSFHANQRYVIAVEFLNSKFLKLDGFIFYVTS